ATPVLSVPILGTLGHSPLGGSNVIKMNGGANSTSVRLARLFPVGPNLTVLKFAYAGVIDTYSAHSCCEQASFEVLVRNLQGNVLQCSSYSISTPGCLGNATLSSAGNSAFTNWKTAIIDLSPYFLTGAIIEVIA